MKKLLILLMTLAAIGGCRSHKEVAKADSVRVQQVQHSHTVLQSKDAAASFDSLNIEIQGVKMVVVPAEDGRFSVESEAGDSSAPMAPVRLMTKLLLNAAGLVTGKAGLVPGKIAGGRGVLFSADKISLTKGKGSVKVQEQRYEKNDSSARDSSKSKIREKVIKKPSSGWNIVLWAAGIAAIFIIIGLVRSKHLGKNS